MERYTDLIPLKVYSLIKPTSRYKICVYPIMLSYCIDSTQTYNASVIDKFIAQENNKFAKFLSEKENTKKLRDELFEYLKGFVDSIREYRIGVTCTIVQKTNIFYRNHTKECSILSKSKDTE